MNNAIKVGFCIAYDWHLLKHALPQVYNFADRICLSVDKDRISWTGQSFNFDEKAFHDFVLEIDKQNKIEVYEDDFHISNSTPMQNEVRQRNRMASFMGEGGWHIQLDCDEYFIDFYKFTAYLKSLSPQSVKNSNVCCAWVILYKQVEEGFLFVDHPTKKNLEFMQIATREPHYDFSRRNGNFNIYTNFRILHQSWARKEEEVLEKVNNWGHSHDFDHQTYMERWKSLNAQNYQQHTNLHHITPATWPRLGLLKGKTIPEVIEDFEKMDFPTFTSWELYLKNSLFFSRLRKLLKL